LSIPDTLEKNQPKLESVVFYSTNLEGALSVIRCLGPLNHLGLRVVPGVEDGQARPGRVAEGDIVVLQRDFCRDLDAYERVMAEARTLKKPVVFDIDDLLFELPENHPDRQVHFYADALLPMLLAVMEADLVTVATDPLREYFQPFNPNIRVVPNYLDDRLWRFRPPAAESREDGGITIGYMGGPSHRPDLEMVLPALLRIMERYPQRISFKFWGVDSPAEIAPFSRVAWSPPESCRYADFAAYFQTQAADIMIAPLVDNLFNGCKSPIKFFEYGAVGCPGVYSRVTPYSGVIEDGRDGLLASSMDEWENALAALVENRDLRQAIALQAQQKIAANWLLSRNAHRMVSIYENEMRAYGMRRSAPTPILKTGKSVARQVNDLLGYDRDRLESNAREARLLTDRLEEEARRNQSMMEQLDASLQDNRRLVEQLDASVQDNRRLVEQLDASLQDNRSLAAQLEDNEHARQELALQLDESAQQNQSLADRLETGGQTIQQMSAWIAERDQEILMYTLSKSWLITRPFRKLGRLLRRLKNAAHT